MFTATGHQFPAISLIYPKITLLECFTYEAHNLLAGSPYEACGGATADVRQTVHRRQESSQMVARASVLEKR